MDDALPERARLHSAAARQIPASNEPHHVSGRVLASWQRSQDYGVSMESVEPLFTGTLDADSLFSECGRHVLKDLHRTLADEPISLMLTDAEGLVLDRVSGDPSLLRALDEVHLAPGFSYSERIAGTNGLGLALADRVPSVVRAEEHYSLSLCSYTCAAAPVLDPLTGRLEGSVNLTTWSQDSSALLLALARSAAENTSAMMLSRSQGRHAQRAPRGKVFRVDAGRLAAASGVPETLSASWLEALEQAEAAFARSDVVAAVGEPGSGRSTLLALAQRRAHPHDRILSATAPAPQDTEAWLSLWSPELGKADTSVIVCDVDVLPIGSALALRERFLGARSASGPQSDDARTMRTPLGLTAEHFADIPAPMADLVVSVVHVPALRDRPDDIEPLSRHLAARARGRQVDITPAATRALRGYAWPGNVAQLERVIRDAATRTDVVDLRHLPPEILAGNQRRLSRIESFERDEIIRVLTRRGITMREATEELGISRATVYRKLAHYDIHLPKI